MRLEEALHRVRVLNSLPGVEVPGSLVRIVCGIPDDPVLGAILQPRPAARARREIDVHVAAAADQFEGVVARFRDADRHLFGVLPKIRAAARHARHGHKGLRQARKSTKQLRSAAQGIRALNPNRASCGLHDQNRGRATVLSDTGPHEFLVLIRRHDGQNRIVDRVAQSPANFMRGVLCVQKLAVDDHGRGPVMGKTDFARSSNPSKLLP
jgi:hypothetical protein